MHYSLDYRIAEKFGDFSIDTVLSMILGHISYVVIQSRTTKNGRYVRTRHFQWASLLNCVDSETWRNSEEVEFGQQQ